MKIWSTIQFLKKFTIPFISYIYEKISVTDQAKLKTKTSSILSNSFNQTCNLEWPFKIASNPILTYVPYVLLLGEILTRGILLHVLWLPDEKLSPSFDYGAKT